MPAALLQHEVLGGRPDRHGRLHIPPPPAASRARRRTASVVLRGLHLPPARCHPAVPTRVAVCKASCSTARRKPAAQMKEFGLQALKSGMYICAGPDGNQPHGYVSRTCSCPLDRTPPPHHGHYDSCCMYDCEYPCFEPDSATSVSIRGSPLVSTNRFRQRVLFLLLLGHPSPINPASMYGCRGSEDTPAWTYLTNKVTER